MGKKYIIELLDECNSEFKGIMVFGLTQEKQISVELIPEESLTPYTEPDMEKVREDAFKNGYDAACKDIDIKSKTNAAYQKGLSDAWDAARKIADMPYGDGEKIFGVSGWHIIEKRTAAETIEKIRQYEQEQENEFKVGDEFENEKSGKKFVVLKMNGKEIDRYIDVDGKTYCMTVKYKEMRKTGRHFPEIATVLEKMREES